MSTTGSCNNSKGFTLLELLAALVLMGILTALAMPKLAAFLRGDELRASAARTIGLMRECGLRARQERRDYELRYDAAAHALVAASATATGGKPGGAKRIRPLKLPEALGPAEFAVVTGGTAKSATCLRFSARGYATPGLITLVAANGEALTLANAPFLGKIAAHPGRPDPASLFR